VTDCSKCPCCSMRLEKLRRKSMDLILAVEDVASQQIKLVPLEFWDLTYKLKQALSSMEDGQK
jgi:hypothetical protein